ncbi:MAG: serine/threonine protein kinase [Gemmataceae bacterium]
MATDRDGSSEDITQSDEGSDAPETGPDLSSPDDLSGQTHGDFHILSSLGKGGMGQVYLAEQLSLKRKVAIKLLKPELMANPVAVSRFRAEAEAVASINHPNIVQVYMIGELDGMPFMALEYVQGITLRDYLVRKGAPDLVRALLIMRQVAAALQRAAEQGIVHRDIKPENILLTRKGEVKVTDFGLSRLLGNERELSLTQTGITMGTPLYMSPEQAQGKAVDPRSDIYSFGVTCYHLLAGRPPFGGQNAVEVALKHVNDAPPPLLEQRPDLPPELVQLVHRMMEKDPAKRPQSGRDILRELNAMRGQSSDATLGDYPGGVPVRTPLATTPNPLAATIQEVTPSFSAALRAAPRVRWKFAGAVLLAVLIGAASRLGFGPARGPTAPSVPNIEPSKKEQSLLSMARGYADADFSDREKLKTALRVNLELALLYIDEHRTGDAEAFAAQLAANKSHPGYEFLGRMLQGVNASLSDDVARSNELFQLAMTDKNAQMYLNQFLTVPPSTATMDFRLLLVRALERNERSGPLPNDLRILKNSSVAILHGRPLAPLGKKGG